jgi:hypothetical protein
MFASTSPRRAFAPALCLSAVLGLASPLFAATVFNEVDAPGGDFGGTLAARTLSTNIGTLTDSPVQLVGTINGDSDAIDAWTFTIPAGRTITSINVTASSFTGFNDYLDLYTNLNIDPTANASIGDLLTAPLVVGNHALAVGPGTYKLTTLSAEVGNYSIQINSIPEPASLGLLAGSAAMALRRRRR